MIELTIQTVYEENAEGTDYVHDKSFKFQGTFHEDVAWTRLLDAFVSGLSAVGYIVTPQKVADYLLEGLEEEDSEGGCGCGSCDCNP